METCPRFYEHQGGREGVAVGRWEWEPGPPVSPPWRAGVFCRPWGQPEQWRAGGNHSRPVLLEQKGRERPGVRLAAGQVGGGPGRESVGCPGRSLDFLLQVRGSHWSLHIGAS